MPEYIDHCEEGYLYATFPDDPDQPAYIDTLYVYPDAREKGAGHYLLSHFVGACIRRNISRIAAEFIPHPDADPERVKQFYQRHDFTFEPEEDGVVKVYRDLK